MPHLFIIFSLLCLLGCTDNNQATDDFDLPLAITVPVSYNNDVRPILEKKCVACHGCFDAPCQLKFESKAGIIRGASLSDAYDGGRKDAIIPTRLFVDADNVKQWRDLNFYSILDKKADNSTALLYDVIALGKTQHYQANSKLPTGVDLGIKRTNQCAVSNQNSESQSTDHLAAMPFSVTGLTDMEFSTLAGWIEQGATFDNVTQALSANEAELIQLWERYLNKTSLERKLVSRWLYEHLFLAHLYFTTKASPNRYFEIVRSYTPPEQSIDIVKTRLPNSDAIKPIYYRIRLVEGATTHKRHISLLFDRDMQYRIEQLFFSEDWRIEQLPAYDDEQRANPFVTFSAIPANARYQFMLDNAEYFTRTFIRGPVCRGQIATDVIRDRFWVMFQDPSHDLYITNSEHRNSVDKLLGLPGQDDNLLEANDNWEKYKNRRNEYHAQRYGDYGNLVPEWSSLASVWQGDGINTNALLTVFRHFDNASVRRGLIGPTPTSIWWMDYPLFERIYYELVVNFDLFGNVAHQLQTRLYFDLLRNGAEHNYLRLIPLSQRKDILNSWYGGLSLLKTHITYAPLDELYETKQAYQSDDAKAELTSQMLSKFKSINVMAEDALNRCPPTHCFNSNTPTWINKAEQSLSSLTSTAFSKISGLNNLPELTFLRVKHGNERTVYSLIRNRSHSNVAFMFGESLRYQPEHDTLTIYPGIAGSYPNFMFDVPSDELEVFIHQLTEADDEVKLENIIQQWGIRRTHPKFWDVLHDFTAWQAERQPMEAGIFDVNRYENL